MKKFVKICMTLVVGLAALGALLYGLGVITRGRDDMEALVDDITGGRVRLGLDMAEDFGIVFNNVDMLDISTVSIFDPTHEIYTEDDQVVLEGNVVNLDINIAGSSFEIMRSEDDTYYVEAKNTGRFQAYVEGDTLYVNVTRPSTLGLEFRNSQVTLYVPEGAAFGIVTLELGAGQVTLEDMDVRDLAVSLGAGQVEVYDVRAETLALEVGAGEANLEDIQATRAAVSVSAGHCYLEGDITEWLSGECAAGNLEIVLSGSVQTDYHYKIVCAAGSIEVGEDTYAGLSTERTIGSDEAARVMELNCAAGSIKVEFD